MDFQPLHSIDAINTFVQQINYSISENKKYVIFFNSFLCPYLLFLMLLVIGIQALLGTELSNI